ncbi:hypothetical protein [Burkholderia anthina]|uniref:hypothetical protein n=1 Tax=Burkholderia anthina TaxID=179879 RepID=UPI00158842F7|nr:hypothetical protein [Burkholderia anthina]
MDMQVLAVEVAKLELSPDSVLLVSLPHEAGAAGADRLAKGLRQLLGNGARWLIVPKGVDFTVVESSDVPGPDREDETRV